MASYKKLDTPKMWASPLGSKAETEEIPQTVDTATDANFSHEYLFPHRTEQAEEDGGMPPTRTAFNAVLKLLGDNIYFMQQGGSYPYTATFSYMKDAIVMYNGDLYQSLIADNKGNTPDSPASAQYWKKLNALKSVNGVEPNNEGEINLDLSGMPSLDKSNTFNADNTFKGKVSLNKLPLVTGAGTPDPESLKDQEVPTMGVVREYVNTYGAVGGSSDSTIWALKVISPANHSKRVSVLTELAGSAFISAFDNSNQPELREKRQFQLTKVSDTDWANAQLLETGSDQVAINFNNKLLPNTEYKVRLRDYTSYNRYTRWSDASYFTTGEDVAVVEPVVVSVEGENGAIETPRIVTSAFNTTDGTDRHYSTQWVIRTIVDSKVVLDTGDDRDHLTSFVVPRGKLKENTSYELSVRYRGERYGYSTTCIYNFTTTKKFSYISLPVPSVENEGHLVLGAPTFNCSAFKVVTTTDESDSHKSTSWQVVDLDGETIWESLEDAEHLRTITMPNHLLRTNTIYKLLVKYHGYLFESGWGETTFQTAEQFEHIAKPSLDVPGAPNEVSETPLLKASEFTVMPQGRASDVHASTSWAIVKRSDNTQVWSSLNDARNLTQIQVPKGKLKPSETYIFSVIYNGKKYGASQPCEVQGTTKANFTYIDTPVLTVAGAPNDVRECALLSGSAFTVISDTGETDTHASSQWTITNTDTGEIIYNEDDSTNLTSFSVPAGLLKPDTNYKFELVYKGATHGQSSAAVVTARTHSVLAYINKPSLTVAGAPSSVTETPLLTGSPFSVFSDNNTQDTHKATDWIVTSVENGAQVWASLNDATNLTSISVPKGNLVEGKEYIFKVRYHGAKLGASEYTQEKATTLTAFDYINAPVLTVAGAPSSVGETPQLSGSPFAVVSSTDTSDTHKASDWIITNINGGEVWSSKNDGTNLTSISVPKGQLSEGTEYIFKVRYIGNSLGASEFAQVRATTLAAFDYVRAPVISIGSGSITGPNDVLEQPSFNLGSFEAVSSSGAVDTHEQTEVKICKVASPDTNVWTKTLSADEGLTSVTVDKGVLEVSTAYKLLARFKGASFGWSEWGELAFTTNSTFTYIHTPILSINGAPNDVGATPLINGGAFTVTPDTQSDTHVSSSWLITTKSGEDVFRSDNDETNKTSLQLEKGLLKPSSDYICYLTYHGESLGDSGKASLEFRTKALFEGVQDPTLAVEDGNADSYDYNAYFAASDFSYIGDGEDTEEIDKVDWHLYKVSDEAEDAEVWKATDSKLTKFLTCFDKYALEPSTSYKLKYRQHAKNANQWSAYTTIPFTTAADLKFPTIKFKMKDKINISKICAWFNSSDFEIKLNGVKNTNIVSSYSNDFILSAEGTVVEIINIKDPTNYPMLTFAGNDGSLKDKLMSIEAPLPPLRASSNGSFVTSLGGVGGNGGSGTSGGKGSNAATGTVTAGASGSYGSTYSSISYGAFSYCTGLTALPENLFKYNTQLTNIGGTGGNGGYGGNGGTGGENGNGRVSGGIGGRGGSGGSGGTGYGAFSYCTGLTALPENLFKYNTQLTNIGGTGGKGCYGGKGGTGGNQLVSSSSSGDGGVGGSGGSGGTGYGAFSYCTGLTTLPENLFKYNTQLANIGVWGDTSGGSINYGGDGGKSGKPHASETNYLSVGFGAAGGNGGNSGTGYGAFSYCTGLTTLPENLFKYNTQLTNIGVLTIKGGKGGAAKFAQKTSNGTLVVGIGGKGEQPTLSNDIYSNSYGAFTNSSKVNVKLRFTATNINNTRLFASGTASQGTVYVPVGSTTANTFTNDTTANVNVVVE